MTHKRRGKGRKYGRSKSGRGKSRHGKNRRGKGKAKRQNQPKVDNAPLVPKVDQPKVDDASPVPNIDASRLDTNNRFRWENKEGCFPSRCGRCDPDWLIWKFKGYCWNLRENDLARKLSHTLEGISRVSTGDPPTISPDAVRVDYFRRLFYVGPPNKWRNSPMQLEYERRARLPKVKVSDDSILEKYHHDEPYQARRRRLAQLDMHVEIGWSQPVSESMVLQCGTTIPLDKDPETIMAIWKARLLHTVWSLRALQYLVGTRLGIVLINGSFGRLWLYDSETVAIETRVQPASSPVHLAELIAATSERTLAFWAAGMPHNMAPSRIFDLAVFGIFWKTWVRGFQLAAYMPRVIPWSDDEDEGIAFEAGQGGAIPGYNDNDEEDEDNEDGYQSEDTFWSADEENHHFEFDPDIVVDMLGGMRVIFCSSEEIEERIEEKIQEQRDAWKT